MYEGFLPVYGLIVLLNVHLFVLCLFSGIFAVSFTLEINYACVRNFDLFKIIYINSVRVDVDISNRIWKFLLLLRRSSPNMF